MTRNGNRGLVYLRRSSDSQENSVTMQLRWAIKCASDRGIVLEAHESDAQYMIENNLHHYKNIYLDTGSGSNLERPGLIAMQEAAVTDARISHLFVHFVDRLARPDFPSDAMIIEQELRRAGLTIVTLNRTLLPLQPGQHQIADLILSAVEYSEAGNFLQKLAERIVGAQIQVAQRGGWTGGRPPYGFIRIRVDAQGKELAELPEGRHVRQAGTMTRIRMHDPHKIQIWLEILDLYGNKGWGYKRIATYLNERGIPSPDAGRKRTDRGVTHTVSGQWNHTTVKSLINNQAILGLAVFGKQSEGRHRRLGSGQPRKLHDSEWNKQGKPKVINNSPDLWISRPAGYAPFATPELFAACQEQMTTRARNQRGVSRVRRPEAYPLAGRIWDMNCGHPLYVRSSRGRDLYVCGLYMRCGATACDHNTVPAERAHQQILTLLRQEVAIAGGRKALEQAIRAAADREATKGPDLNRTSVSELERQLQETTVQVKTVTRNRLLMEDTEDIATADGLLAELKAKQSDLRAKLAKVQERLSAGPRAKEQEIASAMALLDKIESLLAHPSAGIDLRQVIEALNINMWLEFTGGRKGKRKVRKIQRGLITRGNVPPPVTCYGKHSLPHEGNDIPAATVAAAEGPDKRPSAGSEPPEGLSSTKVHRGDRI